MESKPRPKMKNQFEHTLMTPSEQRILICHLTATLHKHGNWVGHMHIQKGSMFLQRLFGVRIDYQFVLYKNSPFSFDLEEDLALMRYRYMIDLEPHPKYPPWYLLGSAGEYAIKQPNPYQREVDFVCEKISAMTKLIDLERVSMVYFLSSENPGLVGREVVEMIRERRPHISAAGAFTALDEVQRIVNDASEQGLIPAEVLTQTAA